MTVLYVNDYDTSRLGFHVAPGGVRDWAERRRRRVSRGIVASPARSRSA